MVLLICNSNAQVLSDPVKIDQSEDIPDPGILEQQPFVKFAHICSFAFFHCSSHQVFLSVLFFFCAAPQLTEYLEEATGK